MENTPQNNIESSLEHNISIAEELYRNVSDRNTMVSNNGGFDTFSVVMYGIPSLKEDYDRYSEAVSRLRKELDEQVSDKPAFVEELNKLGKKEVAERIKSMFQL